ncbi:MAG: hypothetical protein SVJ22_08035, partial [Halobacteriota archaeon]|nr:hypothetical protein [Halobacteriota archaeon]
GSLKQKRIQNDQNAQMHTLEAALVALMMIGAVSFVSVSSPLVHPEFMVIQLQNYGEDTLEIISQYPSIGPDMQTSWEDGNGTWVNVSTTSNTTETGGNVALDTTTYATTYNYVGVSQASNDIFAYENDVDHFDQELAGDGFQNDAANRNDHAEPTDTEYGDISSSDNNRWQTDDPDSYDEMMLWLDMVIGEDISDITQIDFTFEGYNSDTGNDDQNDFYIYVLKDGEDWWGTNSWTRLGSALRIPGTGTDGVLTRSLTSDFSTYIATDGSITWMTGAPGGHSDSLYIDYVEMAVAVPGHYTSGNITSNPINSSDLDSWVSWGTFYTNATVPADTSITYTILDEYDNFIMNVALGQDISGITESTIQLYAEFSTTNVSRTPTLHDWNVTYWKTPPQDPNMLVEYIENESWTTIDALFRQTLPDEVNYNMYMIDSSTGYIFVDTDGNEAKIEHGLPGPDSVTVSKMIYADDPRGIGYNLYEVRFVLWYK